MSALKNHRRIALLLASSTLSLSAYAGQGASPYATEIVSYVTGFGSQSLYNDPNAVLGEPTRAAVNAAFPPVGAVPFHIKIVEPAYNRDLSNNKVITTLTRRTVSAGVYEYGSITVKFDQPVYDNPVNPYGIDLNVFGNSFYVGGGTTGGYVSDTTDMRVYYLAGGIFAEPVVISVSPDNVNWYTYASGPYGDTAFPTQGYAWSAEQHDQTGNGWTTEATDFTKPVNPTLNSVLGAPGNNMPVVDALTFYVNSGGGTGIDLAASGFEWIQYIRVEANAQYREGEIDAFSIVRPAVVGEGLSITPENVVDGTTLYFQDAEDASRTLVTAGFTAIDAISRLDTALFDDEAALGLLPEGDVSAAYAFTVRTLPAGSDAVAFDADLALAPAVTYAGDGADLDVFSWDGTAWSEQAAAYDGETGRVVIEDWNEPTSVFAIVQAGTPGCAADFNGDDTRDVADLFAYINAWLAKTPNADFNTDTTVDVADLFAYINAWLAGC